MRKVPQEGVEESPTRPRLLLPPAAALFSVATFFPKVTFLIGAAVAASAEGAWKVYATPVAWSGLFAGVVVATTVLLFVFRGGPRLLGSVLPLFTFLQLMFVNGRPAAECAAPAEFFGADSMVASAVLEQSGPVFGRFRVSSGFARVTDEAVPPEIQSLPPAERYAWWERQVMLYWHNVLFDLESPVYYGPATPEPLGTLFSEDRKGWSVGWVFLAGAVLVRHLRVWNTVGSVAP